MAEEKVENIDLIFDYVVNKKYKQGITKNEKANIRKSAKQYFERSGQLYYRHKAERSDNPDNEYRELLVIRDRAEKGRIIRSIHMGSGDSDSARCMGSHIGIDRTRSKIMERFFWKHVSKDVRDFILCCERCQKVNPALKTPVGQLHPIPVPSEVMVQIRVDISNLPKTEEGYCCIVVAIDYFSKWPEARALKNHTAKSVAKFLFEDIICRHGCVKIQINDQGREFVNAVSAELHTLTGTKQHMTSAYHPQANGLVERQNRTIKDSFIKSLEERSNWVECLSAVLFAYRTSRHSSTKNTPFQVMYNRQAVLPVELQYSKTPDYNESDEQYRRDTIVKLTNIREKRLAKVSTNIEAAQKVQKENYDKKHEKQEFSVGNRVLLKNLIRQDRKGGRFTERRTGPYTIAEVCSINTYK